MKDSFENSIKESLKDLEYDYNPKAWEQLSAKLDAPTTAPTKSPYKWYIAAAAATAVTVCGFLYFSGENNAADQNQNNQLAEETIITPTTDQEAVISNKHEDSQPTFTTQLDSENQETQPNSGEIALPTNELNPEAQEFNLVVEPLVYQPHIEKNDNEVTPNNNKDNSFDTFISPEIEASICVGQLVSITNNNDFPIAVVFPNGQIWNGKENSVTSLKTNYPGTYEIGYIDSKGAFVSRDSFVAQAAPVAEFQLIEPDKKYDELGLPSTQVSTNVIGIDYVWTTENQRVSGKEASLMFFNKGTHDIKLTVTGDNGCKGSVSKKVSIEEDYNLLATTSFVPTDLDPVNNTFIPRSLTTRDDNFSMIIIDPNDGHVIYETTDAAAGWNGYDQQTGKMVPYQKAYIWKVTIANPKPGEKPVYGGTVVPLERRR